MASRRHRRRSHNTSGSKTVQVRSYSRRRPRSRTTAQNGEGIIEDIGKAIKNIGNFSRKHKILGNTNKVLNATPLGSLLEDVPVVGKVLRKGIREGARRGYGTRRHRGMGSKRGAGIIL